MYLYSNLAAVRASSKVQELFRPSVVTKHVSVPPGTWHLRLYSPLCRGKYHEHLFNPTHSGLLLLCFP